MNLEVFLVTNFHGMYVHFRWDISLSGLLKNGLGVLRLMWERNRLVEQHDHLSLVSLGNQD